MWATMRWPCAAMRSPCARRCARRYRRGEAFARTDRYQRHFATYIMDRCNTDQRVQMLRPDIAAIVTTNDTIGMDHGTCAAPTSPIALCAKTTHGSSRHKHIEPTNHSLRRRQDLGNMQRANAGAL